MSTLNAREPETVLMLLVPNQLSGAPFQFQERLSWVMNYISTEQAICNYNFWVLICAINILQQATESSLIGCS